MIRARALLLLLLAGSAQAETLSLRFEPHPAHGAPIAGEMLPVTLRAVYDRKISREAMTIAPSDSFDWIQTGPDHWQETTIDGHPYVTMERPLALFPRRPGVLAFGPATHRLTIVDEASRFQDRSVTAPPVSVSVGAFPLERGWKFAAAGVTLTDELSADPAHLVDGETVNRRITLRARDTLPEMLPPRPVVSEPWLITFAAPVERRLLLTDEGPVAEVVWTWSFRPETGEPGVVPPVTIPFFNTTTRAMDAVEIPALPIGYASFYSSQVETGRFGAGPRLATAGALLAGLALGAGLILRTHVPETTRAGWRRWLHRISPVTRWHLHRAARKGDLLALRRLATEGWPEAGAALAMIDRALYARDAPPLDRRRLFRLLRGRQGRRPVQPD